MRTYLRRKRLQEPGQTMWERARGRARQDGMPFAISPDMIVIPERCPVLGIPLRLGRARSPNSPSLDRIIPSEGYMPGNIRVISDRANILKGCASHDQLCLRAETAGRSLRGEYRKIAAYVEREALLAEVRTRVEKGGRAGEEWARVAAFLERAFQRGEVSE